MPCEGGEAVMPANEDRLNNNPALVSTPLLKILCFSSNAISNHENRRYFRDFRNPCLSVVCGKRLQILSPAPP
jgi:hypothetical protein